MLGARPKPFNLSLLSQLALSLGPSAPSARADSCLGANRPKANANSWPGADWRVWSEEVEKAADHSFQREGQFLGQS
jgi:hypothetical protein